MKIISPVDGSIYQERDYANGTEIAAVLAEAEKATPLWKNTSIADRAEIALGVVKYFQAHAKEIAEEITWQMGRPIRYTPSEITGGLKERAEYMIQQANQALADLEVPGEEGFKKFIRKESLGPVMVLSPWNYPYLTAVNAVIPAIMAGNPVILKHADQTALCAERFKAAFDAAGAPVGVFNFLHLRHEQIPAIIQHESIKGVFFTGSVSGGKAIQQAAAGKFINMGFELGGKDPAYVAEDASLPNAVENLVDGAFFNSGQSCCGIERIYVHKKRYEDFLDGFVSLTNQYVVGDPREEETTLGPLVRASAAERVHRQVEDAIAMGAHNLITAEQFGPRKFPYMNPAVMVNVNHDMQLMKEESFGPVIGIMPVSSDEEALEWMNDSSYGLTASIWTSDLQRAIAVGDRVDTGTWFMNRCDYLDPTLAWTGVKNSGNGCTLSTMGYDHVTRPKSFHLKQ